MKGPLKRGCRIHGNQTFIHEHCANVSFTLSTYSVLFPFAYMQDRFHTCFPQRSKTWKKQLCIIPSTCTLLICLATAVSLAATVADIIADTVLVIIVILMFHVLSTLTFIFGKCTEAYARMPVSSSFLSWLDKGGGGCAGSQQWRSKNVSGTGQAVLHLWELFRSESIPVFL